MSLRTLAVRLNGSRRHRPARPKENDMNTYLLVHRHPHDYVGTPETAAAWAAWFEELGDALVDLGNPVLDGRAAVGEASTPLPLGGYTLIQAESEGQAAKLAGGCPILKAGGAVEVGRLTPVPGRQHPARVF
jgi:hypothetical protein